jgi:ABC-type transport system involved in multi-copper enzyme maturation permease subunit
MNMIWKIAKKEFLLNIMTFKFAVGTVLCMVLIVVFVPVLADDYQQRLQKYSQQVIDNQDKLRQVKAYRVLTPTLYRRPQVLSIFSQGLEKRLGDSAIIDFGVIPEISAGPAEINPYLSIFSNFDVLLIFKIVMSALALLIAYDVVSGEKEQGTLSLTLSNHVCRAHILLGKLLAGTLTLAVPTTAAFILSLLLLLGFPSVGLQASDWARIGGMYLASFAFVLAVYNVGLLFSCLTRSSALALVLGLFFWVLAIVVIPNGSIYLARRIQPVQTAEAKDEQIRLLEGQFKKERLAEFYKLPRGGFESDSEGPFGSFGPAGGTFNYYASICTPASIECWKKRVQMEASLKSKYAGKMWQTERDYVSSLANQTNLAVNIGRISPTRLYDNVMSALAGTDLADFQAWMTAARTYRDVMIAYIRSKTDDLHSLSYFTQCTEADCIKYEKLPDSQRREFTDKVRQRETPLNLDDLPHFAYSTKISQSIRRAGMDLIFLLVFNVLFYALSFVAFQRYDVR